MPGFTTATGKRYTLPVDKTGKMHFRFGPSETYLFVFNKMGGSAPVWSRLPLSGDDAVKVEGSWDVKMHHSYPDTTWTASLDSLVDFKEMKDTAYRNFMGDVTYTKTVTLSGKLPKYLNLGKVADICEVSVNGKPLGVKWFGERVYDVAGALKQGNNTIEVKVTTLMGNYMQTLKDNKVAQRYILKRNQPYVSAGLIGPVQLY